VRISPDVLRAAMTDTSMAKSTKRSSISGRPLKAGQGFVGVFGLRETRCRGRRRRSVLRLDGGTGSEIFKRRAQVVLDADRFEVGTGRP